MKGLLILKARMYGMLIQYASLLESPLLLAIRLFMANIFLKSGWGKFENYLNDDWSNTVYLFQDIHPVPGIPPEVAAVLGTGGEVILGGLLLVGLLGRFAALGLVIMTVVIEFSLPKDFGDFTDMHAMWGMLLAIVLVRGPGKFSADALAGKYLAPIFSHEEPEPAKKKAPAKKKK